MIGLRPWQWVSEIGNWGLEGNDEGSLGELALAGGK